MGNQRADHLSDALLQDYADGVLPGLEREAAQTHLSSCARCRTEIEAWQLLFSQLVELPRFAPTPGFAERVMARIRIPLGLRVLAWLRRLIPVPATPRTWAVAVTAAAVPAVALGSVFYWIFSYPGVTPGTLAAYLFLQARQAAAALVQTVFGGLLESEFVLRLYTVLDALVRSPGAAILAASAFSALTAAALWVLYRNLVTTRSVDGKYALLFSF
ncbi:MAG: zf-HC2 domain-containing protein [Gemmatimonadetes bacterium]|nr:zf-HC2 domain-containing protein [Gemmatimonadota bacterium]